MIKLSERRLNTRLSTDVPRSPRKTNFGLSLLLAAGALFGSLHSAVAAGPIVTTAEGRVEGLVANGVAQFLGVPFAAPPVGDLRWTPPKKHEPWNNILKTKANAPICAQVTTLGPFAGPANDNEDCLYLNVFTPNPNPSVRLPVIVWVYGGGHRAGGTPGYDGSKLAANGKAVVVTVAYRLNLMGYFAHPALDAEGHTFGNYALLDHLAALKWVRSNIAQFGGDPNRVTMSGESAGALTTGIEMTSPMFAGLFHRAICQSACPSEYSIGINLPTLAAAEAKGTAFSVAAGCGSGADRATAKCLRNLTSAQVMALAGTETAQSKYVVGPLVDGALITEQPFAAFKAGRFSHMPLINGNTKDENNFPLLIAAYFSKHPSPPTAADYVNYVKTTFVPPAFPKGTAAKVLARYPLAAYASPQLPYVRVVTDPFICDERTLTKILASQIPVYAYEFADETAPSYFPKVKGFPALAYHTSEIQYLFPGWHGGPTPPSVVHPLNKKQTKLSDQLVTAWTNFASTGNPNGLGNYPWPRFEAGKVNKPAWLIQKATGLSTLTDRQYSAIRNCDFWNSLPPVVF